MHRRWMSFCELHNELVEHIDELGLTGKTRRVPTLPMDLVEQFVADNLDWTKRKVCERIDRILWGPWGSVANASDDEYDPTVDARAHPI